MAMGERSSVPQPIAAKVLMASGRRCCVCVSLYDRDVVIKGQIAHLNRNPSDRRFENLVWLCFDHHDEYDSKTSQSKGLMPAEVRGYRDRLYVRRQRDGRRKKATSEAAKSLREDNAAEQDQPGSDYQGLRKRFPKELGFLSNPWRYALWQVANQPEFFAYKAGNRCDGVCLIERIDLPDGRIVMACIQMAGNPGNSITNCAEPLCFQICERFELDARRVVWLQHYDYAEKDDWMMVTFAQTPPRGPFAIPTWTSITPRMWKELRLRPKSRLTHWRGHYNSKLTKLFRWETEALLA
jgi:hypothetical protein